MVNSTAGTDQATASVLWLANMFLVLAYDTEYAMVDRDDDLKIGMKTSAITLGRFDVAAIMGFYAAYLAIWAGLITRQVTHPVLWLAFGAALAQVAWHYQLIKGRTREGSFKAFRLNHWLGATLFAGVVLAFALARAG